MRRYKITFAFLLAFVAGSFAQTFDISGSLTVTPVSSAMGENTIHKIRWTTNPANSIDVRARFVVYYQKPAFNVSQLIMATTADSATMDGRLNVDEIDTSSDPNWYKIYISRKDRQTNGAGNVGINLGMVGNPATPGQYNFKLEVYAAGIDPKLPGAIPDDSGTKTVQIREPITSFSLASATSAPVVGVPFALNVTNARDAENNLADGIINISFASGTPQDHIAPDNISLPTLVSIAVKNGVGTANQTLYKDEPGLIALKGTVANGTATALTGNLNVGPGALGSFSLTGYPSSTVAGLDFTSAVRCTVKVFDKWKNPKTDYIGQIYFTSTTDAQAQFDHGPANPWPFPGTDTASFDGQEFEFRTAGFHTFKVVNTLGTVSQESAPIRVIPGPIDSFSFDNVTGQTAGQPFPLNVSNARDEHGNLTSGTVTIAFQDAGNHQAPNGQLPILTNIQVTNGTGSAYQSLVKAETLLLTGRSTSGSVVANGSTTSFIVAPAALGRLTLTGWPQNAQSGEFFTSGITVNAFDTYNNSKTNFNGTVRFTSTDPDPGRVLPPDTPFPNAASLLFSGGQFKLITLGTQTISATSGGVTGTTGNIQVNGQNEIRILRVYTDNDVVSRGQQQIPVRMDVKNNGTINLLNYEANLNFRSDAGSVDGDYVVSSATGPVINAGEQKIITFFVNVGANATLGDITLDGRISGTYGGVPITMPNANVIDSWQVQRPANISILSANVQDDVIQQGTVNNRITVRLANNGGLDNAAAALIDNIALTFFDGPNNVSQNFAVTPDVNNPTTIAGNDTTDFVFFMNANAGAPLSTISLSAQVGYKDTNLMQTTPATVTRNNLDTFSVVTAAAIRILSITSEKTTVTQGQTVPFFVEMQVQNEGGNPVTVDFAQAKTYIQFLKGGVERISPNDITWPTALDGGGSTIAGGATGVLSFRVNRIQDIVETGDYTIFGGVESTLGLKNTTTQATQRGTLTVQGPANIVLQKMLPSQPTATVDDNALHWQVKVPVRNLGGSDVTINLAGSNLIFSAPAGFNFSAPVMAGEDAILSAAEDDTLIFTITRTGSTRGNVTIDASVAYTVNNTGQATSVQASSTGKQTTVLLQNPADVDILQVTSSVHAVERNGSTPNWTVAVTVRNNGEATAAIDFADVAATWLGFYQDSTPFNTFSITRPNALATGATSLAGGRTDSLIYRVTANTAALGDYRLHAALKSIETNRNLVLNYSTLTTPTTTDLVSVVSLANITYVGGTLSPTDVSPNSLPDFRLSVQNSGSADVVLNPNTTTFTLNDGSTSFVAKLDGSGETTIPGNGTVSLTFSKTFLPANFRLGSYVPTVQLAGTQLGQPYSANLDMNGESVTVGEVGDITLDDVEPSTPTVTRGQNNPWSVDVAVTNHTNQRLKFKTASLRFNAGINDVTTKFTPGAVGDTLVGGGQFLNAGATASVRLHITAVAADAPTGQVLIGATVVMSDENDTGITFTATAANRSEVVVQTPAVLEIKSFAASQSTVTRGQTAVWHVGARIKNTGQSALIIDKIDPTAMDLDLVSLDNTLFTIVEPATLVGSQTDTLAGMREDSLFFRITEVKVDPQLNAGTIVVLNASIGMREVNTNRSVKQPTPSTINVTIQDPAHVKVERLEAMIASNNRVNAGQVFYLRALITNPAGANADLVRKATIKVSHEPNTGFVFTSGDTVSARNIAPGDSVWTEPLAVHAPTQTGTAGVLRVNASNGLTAVARNTGAPITPDPSSDQNRTVNVTTETAANFTLDVTSEKDTVSVGDTFPWKIFAKVANSGAGIVELIQPQKADIAIYNQQGIQISSETYEINPEALGADKRLAQGENDTLRFQVSRTWSVAGTYKIKVTVRADELNNIANGPLVRTDSINVVLSDQGAVRILETIIATDTPNIRIEQGVAHVNEGQKFFVRVLVRNVTGNWLQNVKVRLNSGGSSTVTTNEKTIPILHGLKEDSLRFEVQAGSANMPLETFSAVIIEAFNGSSGAPADIQSPIDATAAARIYKPASLNITATENIAPNSNDQVSLGQKFNVRVEVKNEGTEPAKNVTLLLNAPGGLVTIPQNTLALPGELDGGETKSLDFEIVAGDQTTGTANFTASVDSAVGVNSGSRAGVVLTHTDNTTSATLVEGAKLEITKVWPSVPSIKAGDSSKPWFVYAQVRNTGGADLEFVDIADSNITFSKNDIPDDKFDVSKPSGLQNARTFRLNVGLTDTLRYTVTDNGDTPDTVTINARLNYKDLNRKGTTSDTVYVESGSGSVFVEKDVIVEIRETSALTNVQDRAGFALVNRGQPFEVEVTVGTGQFGGVSKVVVQLDSDGNSLATAIQDTITAIGKDSTATVRFSVQADNSWNPSNGEITEKFFAKIVKAFDAGDPTIIVNPRIPAKGADTTRVRIQTPARLQSTLQVGQFGGGLVEMGKEFQVVARMQNVGRAPIGNGSLRLYAPDGYLFKNSQNELVADSLEQAFAWSIDSTTLEVPFTMLAPNAVSGPDSIRAALTQIPQDRNTGNPVQLGDIDSLVVVSTVDTLLTIKEFVILTPDGAKDGILSTEQQLTLQAEIFSSQNLVGRKAILELPNAPENQKFVSLLPINPEVNITHEAETIEWIIQAPKEPIVSAQPFALKVYGFDQNNNRVEDVRTVQILQVVRKANLSLGNVSIDPAGALQGDIASFNKNQTNIEISIGVENTGEASYNGTGKVVFNVGESGLDFLGGDDAEEEFFDGGELLSWSVAAPNNQIDGRPITLSIQTNQLPTDENSGLTVSVTQPSRTLRVFVNEGGKIEFTNLTFADTTTAGADIDSVSSDQPFKVKAAFTTTGVQQTGIRASLYSTGGGFKIRDFEKVIPSAGQHEEEWIVDAPANFGPSAAGGFYVVVNAIDLQSEAALDDTSSTLNVPVAKRTTFAIQTVISDPVGLENQNRVSTEQFFKLRAKINHTGADFKLESGDSIVLRIVPDGTFRVPNDRSIKGMLAADYNKSTNNFLEWEVEAPAARSENLSKIDVVVEKLPRDGNSKGSAIAENNTVTFPIRAVQKAEIQLTSYLHGEADANPDTIFSVRSGNEFDITALLANTGEAGLMGDYQVRLTLPPADTSLNSSYTFKDSDAVDSTITGTAVLNNAASLKVTWRVKAPRAITTEPDTFWIEIMQKPLDEFTRQGAAISDSDSLSFVRIILEAGALIVDDMDDLRDKTGVIRDTLDVPVMGLAFKNKDASGGTISKLHSIRLAVRNKRGEAISPKALFARIAAVSDSASNRVLAEKFTTDLGDSGTVVLDFPNPAIITGNQPHNIKLVANILPNAELKDFQFTIAGESAFNAVDDFDIPLRIADSTGTVNPNFALSSIMAVLLDAGLEEAFFNYPNPFGRADLPATSFMYYLDQDSDVEIRIYTLTGELVKTFNFTQADNERYWRAGLHQGDVTWDGKNGMGHDVLNGVYLAYIKTSNGQTAMTKIAVVR